MKQIFFLLLLVSASAQLLAVDYDAVIDNLYYKFSGSTATVVGCKDLKYWSSAYELPNDGAVGTYWTVDAIIPETVTHNSKTYTVTKIGSEAFQSKDVHSVVIPSTVSYIGEYAFAWTYLTFINIPEGITTLERFSFAGLKVTNITLPSTLNYIGEGALKECHQLQNIIIPENVTTIGKEAFAYCESLASAQLPANLHYIENFAFLNSGLRQITIPNSVWSIGDYAFGYTQLKSIELSNPNCSLGEHVFYETPMESATLATTGKWMFGGFNNVQHKTQRLSITLLDGLTWISPEAFCNTDIETIVIPASVNQIGEGAFAGCTDLKSVNISDNTITSLSKSLFDRCASLQEIAIPEGVSQIEQQVFNGCSALKKITFPTTLHNIGANNFPNNNNSTDETDMEVHIPDLSQWLNMDFAREESGSLFCSNPLSSTANLYINDNKLPEILEIPKDVNYFHFDVLGMALKNVTGIVIPSNVVNIYNDGKSYYNTNKLKWMKIEQETPPQLDYYNFYSTTTTLLVPCGCIKAYRDADNWKEFGEIWDIPYYYEMSVNKDFITDNYYTLGWVDVTQKPTCANELTLIMEAHPREGYHFAQWSDGKKDNPRTIQLTYHTFLTAEFEVGTGLNDVISKNDFINPTKVFHNGQIYIILPDGRTYNTLGTEVK